MEKQKLLFVGAILGAIVGLAAGPPAMGFPVSAQEHSPLTEDGITDEMVARGAEIFSDGTCQFCHAVGAAGSRLGPDLSDDEWLHGDGSPEAIRATIVNGVPRDQMKESRPREMPALGKMMLDDAQIDALAAWVWSLTR